MSNILPEGKSRNNAGKVFVIYEVLKVFGCFIREIFLDKPRNFYCINLNFLAIHSSDLAQIGYHLYRLSLLTTEDIEKNRLI